MRSWEITQLRALCAVEKLLKATLSVSKIDVGFASRDLLEHRSIDLSKMPCLFFIGRHTQMFLAFGTIPWTKITNLDESSPYY